MRRQLAVLWLSVTLWLTGLVGVCQAQNPSPPPDIPLLTRQAKAGDPNAMIALGEAYLDGNGVKRDLNMAIRLFTPVAQANDAHALYLLSFALRERAKPGDIDEALRYATAALVLAKKQSGPNSTNVASIQSQLGFTYQKLGRFGEAIASFDTARRLFERALGKGHPQVGGAYMNLANGLADAGRCAEALIVNETALQIFARLAGNDSEDVASLYMNKGTYLRSLARYEEALEALEKAYRTRIKLEGPKGLGVAKVLSNMTAVFAELTRYGEALEAAQTALAIYEKSESSDLSAIAAIRSNLGWAYQGLGRHDEARVQYRTALDIVERTYGPENVEIMRPLINLANVEDDLGRFEDALTSYHKALAIARKTYGPDHAEVAAVLGRIGNTSRKLGKLDAALDYELQALLMQMGSSDADLDSMRFTFRTLAQALVGKGNRSASILFAKQTVNTHQAVRAQNVTLSSEFRSSLGESFQSSYRRLSEQLLTEGLFSEAQFVGGLLKQEEFFEFTQRGANRTENDHDFEPGSIRLTKSEARVWADLQRLASPVHKIARELRALTAKREKTGSLGARDQARIDDLAAKHTEAMNGFVTAARSLFDRNEADRLVRQKEALEFGRRYAEDLQKDLQAMGPGVVLLQAMSLEDGLHLFVRTTDRDIIHREVKIRRADLADRVFMAVSAVQSRNDDATIRLAELYDLLIRPVRSDLDAAIHRDGARDPVLLLDLSGFLRYVPFSALYDGHRYLVEDYALALYNPAISTKLAAMSRLSVKGAGFGVTHEHPGFPALPGVGHELEAAFRGADDLGIIDGMPEIDEAFNEDSLAKALAAHPQILHIASHFRFRPGNETNSYLLLGNGDGLSLNQLRTQKRFRFRGIDLITLSACETARGGGTEGEEIESFGALAQANGASAVMSTLWQIADASTAQLMTDFYDGLINKGLDKANALKRAQIAMIKGETAQMVALQSNRSMSVIETSGAQSVEASPTSHPYYWAAFILMGNWM